MAKFSFRVTTEARGLSGYQTPKQLAEAEETMSVARSQPHRVAFEGVLATWVAERGEKPLESALGRFCASPKNLYAKGLGEHCYDAGVRYREIVIEARQAMGLQGGHGWDHGDGYQVLTDEQVAARRELAERRLRESDDILRAIMPQQPWRVPNAMRTLCVDERDPHWNDEGVIIHGLCMLAKKYGLAPRSIRDMDG